MCSGFSYFTPVIVSTFGYTPVQTQLLTVPPFVCAFLITMINAVLSDRYGQRGLCTILMSFLALAGYISASPILAFQGAQSWSRQAFGGPGSRARLIIPNVS